MFKTIDYSELKKLESLLNDEVIDQEEYNKKVAQMCSVGSEESANQSSDLIKHFLMFAVIVAFCAAFAIFIYTSNQPQQERDYANVSQHTYDRVLNERNMLQGYKDAVRDFYLDNAVLVIEDGGNIYHRYGCPNIPEEYSYMLYNTENAKGMGYKECSTCFGMSQEDFCTKYIEY